jgi:hypothetical protein
MVMSGGSRACLYAQHVQAPCWKCVYVCLCWRCKDDPCAACRFVHGEEGLQQALKATEALRPGAATALDAATLEEIAGDAPSCSLSAAQVTGVPLMDVMVASGMLKSKGEVRPWPVKAVTAWGDIVLRSAPGCCVWR